LIGVVRVLARAAARSIGKQNDATRVNTDDPKDTTVRRKRRR
jgi:hypothetical protein